MALLLEFGMKSFSKVIVDCSIHQRGKEEKRLLLYRSIPSVVNEQAFQYLPADLPQYRDTPYNRRPLRRRRLHIGHGNVV